MTPEDFKKIWEADGDTLVSIPAGELASVDIPASASAFLELAGLPEETAPFLSFSATSRGHAAALLRSAMNRSDFLVVGSNGSGDPVAIRSDGALVYLNHDADFVESYINRDIETFAETSLKMRDLIAATLEMGGPDAFLDGLIPGVLKEHFRAFLEINDPLALKPGALWSEEMAGWEVKVL